MKKVKAMKFGYLKQTSDENKPYAGKIACRKVSAALQLRVEDKAGNGKAPDYSVWASENGNVYQLGNAWVKNGKDGEQFFSMTLDSPDFDEPLNVTAFPVRGSDAMDIVWNRQRKDGQGKKVAAPEAVDSESPIDWEKLNG